MAAVGLPRLRGGDVGEVVAGSPTASITPHPSSRAPPSHRRPNRHPGGLTVTSSPLPGECRQRQRREARWPMATGVLEHGGGWGMEGGKRGRRSGPRAAGPRGRPRVRHVEARPGRQQSPPSPHIGLHRHRFGGLSVSSPEVTLPLIGCLGRSPSRQQQCPPLPEVMFPLTGCLAFPPLRLPSNDGSDSLSIFRVLLSHQA